MSASSSSHCAVQLAALQFARTIRTGDDDEADSSDQRARGNRHEVRGTSAGMIIVITPHRLRQQPLIPFRFYAPFFTDISAAFSKRD
jgi:hypothetical protein